MDRDTVFRSIAKYAAENKMPLDAAAVNASDILIHYGLNQEDDTMETLMAAIQAAYKKLKEEKKNGNRRPN